MKKNERKDECLVQGDHEAREPEKINPVGYRSSSETIERLWFVQFAQLRKHSRVLYIPLDATIVRLYHLKKGDVLKFMLLELRRSPSESEPIHEVSEEKEFDEGEL